LQGYWKELLIRISQFLFADWFKGGVTLEKNLKIGLSLAAAGLVTLLGLLLVELQTREASVRDFQEVAIGGAFTLTNEKGELRSEADFAGAPMLIYFGFTYCPDVCPMSLDVKIGRAHV